MENVIATPPLPDRRMKRRSGGVQIASQVREYLKRGVIQNAVNMPSIDHQQYTQMQPYIMLAEKCWARFLPTSYRRPDRYRRFQSLTPGRIAEWNTELIRNAAIQGVLNQRIADGPT